jgi:hypothetical protein
VGVFRRKGTKVPYELTLQRSSSRNQLLICKKSGALRQLFTNGISGNSFTTLFALNHLATERQPVRRGENPFALCAATTAATQKMTRDSSFRIQRTASCPTRVDAADQMHPFWEMMSHCVERLRDCPSHEVGPKAAGGSVSAELNLLRPPLRSLA